MLISVISEARFYVTPDGAAWTAGGPGLHFWQRYLAVFDGVRVMARARVVSTAEPGWSRVDGAGVQLVGLPYYQGVLGYLRARGKLSRSVSAALRCDGAVMLRVPSELANIAQLRLRRRRRPFGVEVVGDPDTVFAAGVVRHPLRPLLRWYFAHRLRRQCHEACGAAYVTHHTLQAKYPICGVRNDVVCTSYSSVELSSDWFTEGKHRPIEKHRIHIVTVASLEQMYKGIDTLLEAIGSSRLSNLPLSLTIVGDGRCKGQLQRLAAARGLDKRVQFKGQIVPGRAMRTVLDEHTLFVLPSRTEGLPRAMIEAMARGLPCIGTTVGGIPELLEPDEMIPPNDPEALAANILEVVRNPARMEEMGRRNREKARGYAEVVLAERRRKFYEHIRDRTLEWEQECARTR